MPERWVLNASPLIVLAKMGREDLLLALADEIVVPRAVATEIDAGPAEDRARQVLASGRFTIVDTPSPSAVILAWDLGTGETAVLSFALTRTGWTVILDDAAARKCARSLSLPVKGTFAIILLAKQRGLVPSAVDVLGALRATGFRLDDRIIHEVLRRTVGEDWIP